MDKLIDDDLIHDRIDTHCSHFSAVRFSSMSADCSVESLTAEHFMNSLQMDSFMKNSFVKMLAAVSTADMIAQHAVD